MRACEHAIERVNAIASQQGLPFVRRFAAIIGAWLELARHDFNAVGRLISQLDEVIVPTNLYDVASVYWLSGQAAIQRIDAERALAEARIAVEIFDEAGTHFHRLTARNILVWGSIYRGDTEAARRWIAQAREIAGPLLHNYTEQVFHGAEAWMALDAGDQKAAAQALRLCFGPASQQYDRFMFGLWRNVVPRLAAAALDLGIETETVRRVIRYLDCRAPSPTLEAWPWRVRIYTLGRFEIYMEDKLLSFGAKTPRKPLALLKALIGFGGACARLSPHRCAVAE